MRLHGDPEDPVPAIADGMLLEKLDDWATGTRFTSFAERTNSLKTCVPEATLERLADIRATLDPDGLLVAPHLPA